ncbi:hypothetical protein [Photorhabdus akhurstii]
MKDDGYRSINAFAQVVGRILRAIPDDEITAFEIDNNGKQEK